MVCPQNYLNQFMTAWGLCRVTKIGLEDFISWYTDTFRHHHSPHISVIFSDMGDLLVKPGANMGPPSQIDMVMLPPLYSEKTEIPLLKSRRPSFHLRDVVEAYMISKRSGLDGSIHKALDTTDPRLTLDPDRHKWKEVEIEEKNL
jgi:hypothetical protein